MLENEADTNFVLLAWSRNVIGWFMKTYLHKPIKMLEFYVEKLKNV